jgi:hypothetical protein
LHTGKVKKRLNLGKALFDRMDRVDRMNGMNKSA